MNKRSFLKWLLGVTGSGTLLSIFYPLFRFLTPPEKEKSDVSNVVAGQSDDFAKNTGKIIKFGTQPALLVRTSSGEFKAYVAICTHLQCTVQFRADNEDIWCACHNGIYDLQGKNISGPPPRPLEPLTVRVVNNQVIISKS